MEQNPYESPREAVSFPGINWRRVCLAGLWIATPSLVVLLVVPTFTFFPRERPILAIVTVSLALISLLGFLGGGITAIVGGIGWLAHSSTRRP
jgi:hypothetical protein